MISCACGAMSLDPVIICVLEYSENTRGLEAYLTQSATASGGYLGPDKSHITPWKWLQLSCKKILVATTPKSMNDGKFFLLERLRCNRYNKHKNGQESER